MKLATMLEALCDDMETVEKYIAQMEHERQELLAALRDMVYVRDLAAVDKAIALIEKGKKEAGMAAVDEAYRLAEIDRKEEEWLED